MNKIIAGFDGLKYAQNTATYAIQLARENDAHLVGVFLDDLSYSGYTVADVAMHEQGGGALQSMERLDAIDKATRQEAASAFQYACSQAGIHYSIHHDKNTALRELVHETVYADLLVINGSETLTHHEEELPTRFIRDLLSDAQCPVLIVPRSYKPVEEIIFLYDGQPASIYAIRMLSYTIPSFCKLPSEVISVKDVKQSLHLPDNRLMKEFMKRHFPEAQYKVLKGLPEPEIVQEIKDHHKHPLIALGVYQRGKVSRWFRPSLADILMKELSAPLFMARSR